VRVSRSVRGISDMYHLHAKLQSCLLGHSRSEGCPKGCRSATHGLLRTVRNDGDSMLFKLME